MSSRQALHPPLFALLSLFGAFCAATDPLSAQATLPGAAAGRLALGPQAAVQLEQIYREKKTRTPAQKKLATPLVYAVRALAGDEVMRDLPRRPFSFLKDDSARVAVDVQAEVTAALLAAVEQAGGVVVSSFPQYRAVRAFLPLSGIERLAARPEVAHIRPAAEAAVWRASEKKINTSQGDVAHRAAQARTLFGVDGTGVKVGVLSDSVDPQLLASLAASGDLPGVTVLAAGHGQSEGTAMLEILHDLAPGAQLSFATANGGEAAFADNITRLRDQGCRVIVDDVGYFAEPVFQDGIVAQAVTSAAAAGVAYFSAAGNAGNRDSGAGGVWEGDFKRGAAGTFGTFTGGTVHDFGNGVLFDEVLANVSAPITLQWSDPFGASVNDYDLCLVDATASTVLGCSTDLQDLTDDPMEQLTGIQQAGTRLAIINANGAQQPRFLHLSANGGRLAVTTTGQTSGHAAEANAFAIAAVDVGTAHGGAFAGGAANPVEAFSSDGPRKVFFTASGAAITPGNVLATGGATRQKPDFAAADGVATASSPPGGPFNPFFGTSAAAPHAAAIAALMLQYRPTLTLGALRGALQAGALDVMTPGVDRDSGYGLLDAVKAVDAAGSAGGTQPCVRDAATACLAGGRFEVAVDWQTGTATGSGQVMSFGGERSENDQSVFWWFFAPTNFELGVKVLDACVPALGNKHWVFISGLTDQGWTVHLRDSLTGRTKTYANGLGHLSQTFADTAAFDCP